MLLLTFGGIPWQVNIKSFCGKLKLIFYEDLTFNITLPTSETLSGKNARAHIWGISGSWVLNKIIQKKKKYLENMKKIVGAIWKLPAK